MIPCLSAPEARQLAKLDIPPEGLCRAILGGAYADIYAAAFSSASGWAGDFGSVEEDQPALARAMKQAAELLRRNGYRVDVLGETGLSIHWDEVKR